MDTVHRRAGRGAVRRGTAIGSRGTGAQSPGTGGGPPVRIGVQVDFDDTPEEAAVRTSVRAWLEEHADRREIGIGGDQAAVA